MPFPQNFQHIFQAKILRRQQNQVVKHQIRCFAEEQIGVIVFGFNHQLYGFLTDFLSNFIDAFLE